jgi:hypothetical protein
MPDEFQPHGAILSGCMFGSTLHVKMCRPKNYKMSQLSTIKAGVYHLHELPTAQPTKTVVDPKATRRNYHYYISNHKTDRTPTLQNYWETVQKCEFQHNCK